MHRNSIYFSDASSLIERKNKTKYRKKIAAKLVNFRGKKKENNNEIKAEIRGKRENGKFSRWYARVFEGTDSN